MPIKKGTLGINFYTFVAILFLTAFLSSAACPRVKCKNFKGLDKASKIYSGYNMSKF